MMERERTGRRIPAKYAALVKWAVDFYDHDYLFVELSPQERARIDGKLREILISLGRLEDVPPVREDAIKLGREIRRKAAARSRRA